LIAGYRLFRAKFHIFKEEAGWPQLMRITRDGRRLLVSMSGMSDDPSLDLADISPSGNFVFVSLRGPNPLSGDPHSSTGITPGVGVVQLEQGGRTGSMKTIVRISNRDANRVERADAHGIRVRLK
jgi:hypothetical protein